MIVYYFKDDIRNVTEFYYKVILEALCRNGNKIIPIQSCGFASARKLPHNSYILVTTLKAFAILYISGHRNFIFWYQGISPEEIYMMKGSKFRYWVDSFIEKISIKKVRYKIGVSNYLFRHFENKYHIKISLDDVFIMPCFNSGFNKQSFLTPRKYEANVFCYAGGMQPWQGFDKIVRLYKDIEKKRDDVFLKVYSKEIDIAKTIIEEASLKRYSIDCVPQEKMDEVLSNCKFGFIIREDTIINNVATPTKLATYIGNGVIPIFTSSIKSFRELSENYDYLCCIEDEKDSKGKIISLIEKVLDPEEIAAEYTKIFDSYYNREKYIEGLRHYLFLEESK